MKKISLVVAFLVFAFIVEGKKTTFNKKQKKTSDIAYYDGNNPTPTTDEEEYRDYLEIPTPKPATIEEYKDGLPTNDDFTITDEQKTTLCTWNKETSWTVNNENITKAVQELGLGSDLGQALAATRCFIHYNGKWEYADKADFISEWKQDNTSVTFSKPPEDITESNSKIYCVFVSYIKKSNINLVKNGNFDDYEYSINVNPANDTKYPFKSDYTWGNTYPGGFMISTAVGKTDGSGSPICDGEGDHTKGKGGNGLYFIANGPNNQISSTHNPAGGDLLWQQTLDIGTLQGRYFAFSCWGQCWCDNRTWTNPAKIQWKVDSKNLGEEQKIDYKYCEWKQISAIWKRIDTKTITLSLHNVEKYDNGNDFGLDDIFFGPCVVHVDIVEVTLGQRVDKPTEGTLSLCSILNVEKKAESIKKYIKEELYPENKGYIFDETQIDENTNLDDFEVIIQKKIKCGDGTETTFDWKILRVTYDTNTEKEWKSDRPKPYDDTSAP